MRRPQGKRTPLKPRDLVIRADGYRLWCRRLYWDGSAWIVELRKTRPARHWSISPRKHPMLFAEFQSEGRVGTLDGFSVKSEDMDYLGALYVNKTPGVRLQESSTPWP